MTFSTLTFNMQNGQPWTEDDALDIELDRTIEFLRCQDADVVFLQEVEQGFDGGRQIEPPPHYTRLREGLPGYDSVFSYPAPNGLEIPFGLGLAIFCKSELREFEKTDLPAPDIAFEFGGRQRKPSQRLLIAATADIGGRSVRLLNTHLQAFFMIGASSVDHPAQRAAVERALRAVRGAAILAGDLNNAPGEGVVEQFAGAGFQAVQDSEPTWKRRPFAIDHLLFNSALRLVGHEVIPTTCSDHHALRAEFAFAG
jgi:endonuclease/exonuclease/phosphatase family metal-dependent hydrolase